MTTPSSRPAAANPENPWISLLINIAIPALVLMKLSGEQHLGPVMGLLVALSFPLVYGIQDALRRRRLNFISALGVVSTLLTGGIGLLQLDPRWLAVKEAAIPAVIGIVILLSAQFGYPLVKTLLYNPKILDTEKIGRILRDRGHAEIFEERLLKATYLFSATFFFSAVMNYLLATWIVTSPAGSEAFNEELGRLTLISYPVIAVPSMAMMLAIFYFLWRSIHGFTGLKFEEMLAETLVDEK